MERDEDGFEVVGEGVTSLVDAEPETWSLLADALDPCAPALGTREKLVEALRGNERFAPFVGEVASAFGLTESEVHEAFSCARDPAAWRPSFLPGSEVLSTPALGRAHAVLVRVARGTRIAKHGHPRQELTYVLDGWLVEDGVRRVGPGELVAPAVGSEHEIAVDGADDCFVVFGLSDVPR